MKVIISESQYRLIKEYEEYDKKLIDIFISDSDLALELAKSVDIDIIDVIERNYPGMIECEDREDIFAFYSNGDDNIEIIKFLIKVNDLVGKEFNSCEELGCGENNYKTKSYNVPEYNFNFIIDSVSTYCNGTYNINIGIEDVEIEYMEKMESLRKLINNINDEVSDSVFDIIINIIEKYVKLPPSSGINWNDRWYIKKI